MQGKIKRHCFITSVSGSVFIYRKFRQTQDAEDNFKSNFLFVIMDIIIAHRTPYSLSGTFKFHGVEFYLIKE